MEDLSLLLVKPEIFGLMPEVKSSVIKRGYEFLLEEDRSGWRRVMKDIYEGQLNQKLFVKYVQAYQQKTDAFGLFVLRHKDGNTIAHLKNDEGHYRDYQETPDGSLRAEFGLPSLWNIPVDSQYSVIFNGLHCPGTLEDLQRHLGILELHQFVQ